MADASQSEWNFFQFDPRQVGNDWAVGSRKQQYRMPGMKMSNFGALNFGSRMSTDYTRINFGFEGKAKLEGSDKFGLTDLPWGQEAERNQNPWVLNSTVKKVRDDQFTRMGMSKGGKDQHGLNNPTPHQVDEPDFDVMDINVSKGPWTVGINYPTEGWRSFGGKYDFHIVYDGTLR